MRVASKFLIYVGIVLITTLTLSSLIPIIEDALIGTAKTAVIKIHGPINIDSDFLTGSVSADTIIKQLKTANDSNEIKAIILDINSPGGSPVATYEIVKTIETIKKPIISVIRDTGTSGAYWIAISTDHVISNDLSIVGSVGVTASYLEISELMNKYGIEYVRLVSGEQKDIANPYKNLTTQEKERLQTIINKIFQKFKEYVDNKRNITEQAKPLVYNGTIFIGTEAKENGLIDGTGGLEEAKEWIKQKTNSNKIILIEYSQEPSILDLLTSLKNNNPLKQVLNAKNPTLS